MLNKTMKKIVSGALAVTSVFACAATFTACETSHPEVKMTISFNDKEYDLEYKMYRNINPATTKHFIWLVEQNYYDGLCIHNYDADNLRMYTGRYEMSEDEANGGLQERNYYDFVQDESRVASFPHSVWREAEMQNSLYTLRGEFADNAYNEDAQIKQSYGSLSMYYTSKTTLDSVFVEYDKEKDIPTRKVNYGKNCATSMFFISMKETESTVAEYCTFATLTEDGKKQFEKLIEAMNEYIESIEEDAFTQKKYVMVDADDLMSEDFKKSVSYQVPNDKPIVIKDVTVTKY